MHPTPLETLPADFGDRLEQALEHADRRRRSRTMARRVVSLLPLVLLIGPVAAWRLTEAAPGGPHVVMSSLAWVTFLLDVGVHLDSTLLSYLGLTQLPTMVGALILIVLTFWLLSDPGNRE